MDFTPSGATLFARQQRTGRQRKEIAKPAKRAVHEMEDITVLGGWVNVGLALVKTTAGVVGRSPAMVADAAHSVSDLLSDVVTFATLRIGARRADTAMPYGYGKIEAVGAMLVAVLLTIGTWHVGRSSLTHLVLMRAASAKASLAQTGRLRGSVLALAAALGSIAAKETVARATERVAEKHNSLPLKVNAMHHRSDALSSVVAAVGIAGALCGWPYLDPLSGLIVAGFVGKMALEVWKESFASLVDAAANDVIEEVTSCLKKHSWPSHVAAFSGIRAKRTGNRHTVDLWVTLRPHRSLQGDVTAARARQQRRRKEASAIDPDATEGSKSTAAAATALLDEERLGGLFGREREPEPTAVPAIDAIESTQMIRSILMEEIPSICEVSIQLA